MDLVLHLHHSFYLHHILFQIPLDSQLRLHLFHFEIQLHPINPAHCVVSSHSMVHNSHVFLELLQQTTEHHRTNSRPHPFPYFLNSFQHWTPFDKFFRPHPTHSLLLLQSLSVTIVPAFVSLQTPSLLSFFHVNYPSPIFASPSHFHSHFHCVNSSQFLPTFSVLFLSLLSLLLPVSSAALLLHSHHLALFSQPQTNLLQTVQTDFYYFHSFLHFHSLLRTHPFSYPNSLYTHVHSSIGIHTVELSTASILPVSIDFLHHSNVTQEFLR
mmetsp:Transcript_1552/g.2791  ORF Transcript_1552/g.2791 Transcript_1552/m.2791 type:complete len:269 (-) Transcript_1552:403-1209(-)